MKLDLQFIKFDLNKSSVKQIISCFVKINYFAKIEFFIDFEFFNHLISLDYTHTHTVKGDTKINSLLI
jgi:hypothetical protein